MAMEIADDILIAQIRNFSKERTPLDSYKPMPLKSYEIGSIRVSFRTGESRYAKHDVIDKGRDFEIVRGETENQEADEIRYSYVVDGKEVVFIRGHHQSPECFHIDRIENTTKDGTSGKFIPKVFSAMEQDLRKRGATKLSTTAIAKLAPILVKRYGFVEEEGKSVDNLRSKQSSKMPGKAFGLEKTL